MAEVLTPILEILKSTPSCSTDNLATVCKLSATDERCTPLLDNIEEPQNITKNLLEICMEGRADNDKNEPDLRRTRLAIRALINFCNRSIKFKKSITSELVPYCRCIIRIPEVQVEGCAFLVAIGTELHKAAFFHEGYSKLLTDVLELWNIMEENSWITAYFFSLLETDFAFLSMCHRDLSAVAFCTLLEIMETILDSSETGLTLKVHPNNVIFCVDFVERILYEINEELPTNCDIVLKSLILAIEIIGNCAFRQSEYRNELHAKTSAVLIIVDVLEAVLHAQADAEEEEFKNNPRISYPDRPAVQVSCKVPHVIEDKRLVSLASVLLSLPAIRGNMKCAAVRSIGNLCCDSPRNQRAAGQHGGIVAVLRCTKKRPEDKPFITQWAIATLRHMMISCPENQDIVVSLNEQPSNIIDRNKLLKELGVELIQDKETGKLKIKRAI